MKLLVQRVLSANVVIEGSIYSTISAGLLLYVCFEKGDSHDSLTKAVNKLVSLRIFNDEADKMNLNINQSQLEVLSISQFTLSWDGEKGNRPSFDKSMDIKTAEIFYKKFNSELQTKLDTNLKQGIFQSDMKVESINDGPVTFFMKF